jgi:predicted aldo/keto reductase-like oxidoreductase
MSALEKAKAGGLVKHIGITSHQIDVAKKAVKTDRFETIMFPFNFITSEASEELIPLCRQHDVGFICMKPMAGGMVDNASIAFKYLFQFPDILPVPGIEKIAEIEEIVRIFKESSGMTPSDKKEMVKIKETLGSKFCHRCDYCQPCTVGIPISGVLTIKSFYKRVPPERFVAMTASSMEKAANCADCGECENRCPYNLPIREMLKEELEWYRSIQRQAK